MSCADIVCLVIASVARDRDTQFAKSDLLSVELGNLLIHKICFRIIYIYMFLFEIMFSTILKPVISFQVL